MGRKKLTYITQPVRRPDGTLRGIRVTDSEGGREFLRAESIPEARKAEREGAVTGAISAALEAYAQTPEGKAEGV